MHVSENFRIPLSYSYDYITIFKDLIVLKYFRLGHRVRGVQDANIFMIRLTAWSLIFSFIFRMVDIAVQGFEGLLVHWLNAISPILVPLLTAWNVIPLVNFYIG